MLSSMKASLCPYEKTILSNQFSCTCSRRGQLGERAIIECEQADAQLHCKNYLKAARLNARFALKIEDAALRLPFGKESKLLYGSLLGLMELTGVESVNELKPDIHQLILTSHESFGNSAGIPYEIIVRHIAGFTPRRGRRQHKADD